MITKRHAVWRALLTFTEHTVYNMFIPQANEVKQMELIKEIASYLPAVSTEAEHGDIWRTDYEEILADSPLDDIIIRCDRCCEMIAYTEKLFYFRSGGRNRYVFCQRCAEKLFGI